MPSEQQLNSALREKQDLERELKSLQEADDPQNAADRIMNYISETQEGLVDMDNNPWIQPSGCCCIIL